MNQLKTFFEDQLNSEASLTGVAIMPCFHENKLYTLLSKL